MSPSVRLGRTMYRTGRLSQGEATVARVTPSSCPRMGAAVDFQQSLGIDGGVDLRRRQRGVAEQLLDRTQIPAARQQMRCEGMAQRMRRRGLRQPELAAQPRHRKLDDAWGERAASGADEQG